MSSGSLALLKQSADGVPPAEQAITRQYHTNAVASGSTLRLCQWQLLRQLRPLAFHDRPHLIGDDRDVLNLEHVFVQPPQVRRLTIADARRVGRLIPSSRAGGTTGLERLIGQARAAEALLKGISRDGIGEAEADGELLRLMPAAATANRNAVLTVEGIKLEVLAGQAAGRQLKLDEVQEIPLIHR